MPTAPFPQYRSALERDLRRGIATEHTHRPALKQFLEALDSTLTVINEPRRISCGAPDLVVGRDSRYGLVTLGHVETKDVGTSLDGAERDEQVRRYLAALENFLLTDYLEFRWYVNGLPRLSGRLGRPGPSGTIQVDPAGVEAVEALLRGFLERQAQPTREPRELAQRLARLTHLIRDVIVQAFYANVASESLRDLKAAFAEVLIPDLSVVAFADMFSQTLTYGLFAARVTHQEARPFRRQDAAREIPRTNPFLRRLFGIITGPDLDDEPFVGFVDDVAQLLAQTDIASILADFGARSHQQDPVVHFYETFLAAYDPDLREQRGVYYTPEPVVSYIVRSVDSLLRTQFGLSDGLADTTRIRYIDPDDPEKSRSLESHRVLVLDPACGTGTFLYAVVDLIRNLFIRRGSPGVWSTYVRDHLLPRVFGFELLMAPYAVAHLKLGLQLAGADLRESLRAGWSHDFSGDERLGVYLTNSLEAAIRRSSLLVGSFISEEANAAASIKNTLPIMVVLGNPPYSADSANAGVWVEGLVRDYYFVDGVPLRERNPRWLQDDYVKFIRFGQWRIAQTGAGILAFITNRGYLNNPTFRGMRQHLIRSFTDIYVLDLHGDSRRREQAPDGSEDRNVFDIQQGVAIGIFIKDTEKVGPARVHHADLWGQRELKYDYLLANDIARTGWTEFAPRAPFYPFVPVDARLEAEYEEGWKLTDIFRSSSVGIVTARDALTVQFSPKEVWRVVQDLVSLSVRAAREKYELPKDTRDWTVELAQSDLRESGPARRLVQPILYRPFDLRYTYYTGRSRGFLCMPRAEVMSHMVALENLALISARSNKSSVMDHFFVSRWITEAKCGESTTQSALFPLYVHSPEQERDAPQRRLLRSSPWSFAEDGRTPNLSPAFVTYLEERWGMSFVPHGPGDLRRTFGPEDVLFYSYGLFFSRAYRTRYLEFLQRDFPRVCFTTDQNLLRTLHGVGRRLAALHLGTEVPTRDGLAAYPQRGNNLVDRGFPKYRPAVGEGGGDVTQIGRVYINEEQYFDRVPEDVWEFTVGGHQVCQQWLKSRRGMRLNFDDLTHYQRMVNAVEQSLVLMDEIDGLIPVLPIP